MKIHLFFAPLLTISLLFAPAALWAEEGKDTDSPPPPPPENWKPAGEVNPGAPVTGAQEDKPLIPDPMISVGSFELSLHGRVQALVGLVGDDSNTGSGDLMNRDGFRVRRARFGISGQVDPVWHYDLELDLIDEDNGGNALIDASITWQQYDFAWIKAGAFKPGFSRTLMTSSGDMQFMERPYWVNRERSSEVADAQMLDLNHQVGMAVGGSVSLFSYQVGVFNGSPGFSKGDLNDGLLYALRLGVGMGELGPTEADLERGDFRWKLGLNGYINHDAAAEFRGAGLDLAVKWAGLSFYAEALWAKGIPNDASEDVSALFGESERWGMYAQTGYLLPFDFMDLELAVRFAMLDDQVHIDDEGDLWELTAGINAYFLGDTVKVMLNYVLREEMNGADLDNDLLAAMLQLKF